MKRAMLVLSGVVLLCACVNTQLVKIKERMSSLENEPESICDSKTCPDQWARAQLWLAKNAHMKIQTATDTIIQTYNVTDGNPVYTYTIMKEPLGDGRYKISIKLICGNLFGCIYEANDLRHAIYHYLNTGEDVMAVEK